MVHQKKQTSYRVYRRVKYLKYIFRYKKGNGNGVDLNRNYDYKFALDDIGSSSRQCDEDYRGAHAFSEPETQAVKYFVENFNKGK